MRDRAFAALQPIESDFVAIARPGLDVTMGDGDTLLTGRMSVGVQMVRFARFSEYNQTSPYLSGNFRWTAPRWVFETRGDWDRSVLPSVYYRENDHLVPRTTQAGSAALVYDATARSRVRVAADWEERDFGSPTLAAIADSRTVSGAAEWHYEFSERLFVGPGFRPRTRTVGRGPSLSDHASYLYLSWEATPTISVAGRLGSGRASAGADVRKHSYGSSSLEARATLFETVLITAGLAGDLSTNGGGSLQRDVRTSWATTWSPRESLQTRLEASWSRLRDFRSGRNDRLWEIDLRQSVTLARRITLAGTLRRTQNASTQPGFNYENWMLQGSGAVRW